MISFKKMISSMINSLKNYKALESKFHSNLLAKNIEFTRFKLHSSVKAHFHSLIAKENFPNLNLSKNNRTFANTPQRNNLFRMTKYNYNFKDNVKLNEDSSSRKSGNDSEEKESFGEDGTSNGNKSFFAFTKKKEADETKNNKESAATQENKGKETKRIIVMKKREYKNKENKSNLNESSNKDNVKNSNFAGNSNKDKGTSENNDDNNMNKNNKNATWDDFFDDKYSSNINQDPDKAFYNSNFNRIARAKEEQKDPSSDDQQAFSRQKNSYNKTRGSGNKWGKKAKSESRDKDLSYENYVYNDDNYSNEGDFSESEKLGRSIDTPNINKHIVLNRKKSYTDDEDFKNSFDLESQHNLNFDYNQNTNNTSGTGNDLNNNANNNKRNNSDKSSSYSSGSSRNKYNDQNNSSDNSNYSNNNSDSSYVKNNTNFDFDFIPKRNTRYNSTPHSGSSAGLPHNSQTDGDGMPQAKETEESLAQKEKKLLNKLTQYVANFERWQFNVIFSKHLNIDVDLISFDLIKKFEDELKADKILLRDLALDMVEFYPKMRTYERFRRGALKLQPRNVSPKHLFVKKLLELSPLFEGIVKEDLFVDNFIFFQPLAQYIKENITMHKKNVEISKKVLTFNQPENFFPLARKMKRKFVYHMGPTNSGKTSNALERLVQAESGIYLAPLRLLAWEIYEKLTKKDVKCTLLTGQDRVIVENETHYSMTIEKCDFRRRFEVAVIDEIQMIEDYERGSAWTNAVLGVQADEVHLCGDERGFYLLKQLCDKTGDELFFKKYNRFSNLIVERNTFDYSDLRKGDCVIAFAKTKIMEIKRRIVESKNGDMDACAVIYGDLPSETKKDQAKMFNELTFSSTHNSEVKYDYLVASDAIGMGLNLNINRIIFSTCAKERGTRQNIEVSLLKQIAGRAGRSSRDGFVTAFRQTDLDYIRKCLGTSVSKGSVPTDFAAPPEKLTESYEFSETEKTIKKACLFPKISDVLEIANKLNVEFETFDNKKVCLYDVFMQFELYSNSNDLYFIKDLKKALKTSYVLRDIESAIEVQYNFVMAPCKTKEYCVGYLKRWFDEFKNGVGIIRIPQEFNVERHRYLNRHVSLEEIIELQDKHNCLEVYINLSYKYRNNFIDGHKSRMLKAELTNLINLIIKHGHTGGFRNQS